MAVVIAALAAAAPAAASQQGLTMSVYNNSAWYGAPLRSSVVPGFDVSVPIERTGGSPTPFSVEITGSLTYPSSAKPCFENDHGCFTFNCSFGAASYGFLWFDDHLVCQNGAYVLHPDSFDGSAGNPLRVLSKKEITVRLQAYLDPAGASLEAAGADPQRLAIEQNGLELRSVEAAEVEGAHRAQLRGADLVRLQHQLVDRQPPEDALVLAGESAKVGARRREGAVRPHRLEEVVVDARRRRRRHQPHAGRGAQQ